METSANPCAALPSDGSGYGNWPPGQAAGEPQSCFDDVVALANAKAEVSPDKNVDEDTVTAYGAPAGPVGWESQAPPPASGDPSSSTRQVTSQEDPASSAGGRAGVASPDQRANPAGAGTAKAAGGNAGGRTPQKTDKQGRGDGGAVPIAGAGRWDVGRKEGVAVAQQLAENGLQTPSGDKPAAKGHGSGAPSAAQPSRRVHPAVTRQQPREGGPSRPEAKMGVAQVAAKESRPAGPKGQGRAQPESPASSMGQSGAVTWLSPGETQTGGVAKAGSDATESPLHNLGEQIRDSLQASVAQGQRQVTIRLQPPELGTVVVRFREQGEHLDGTLEVARTETRCQIEQALPEVVRNLQDAGVTIRRLDVTNGEPSGQEPGSGLSQRDVWSGQYASDHHRDHVPASPMMPPQPTGDYAATSQETPVASRQKLVPHGRIDVLL